MRSLLVAAAAVALVAAAGACGNSIAVPDQGVVVLGCRSPSQCYLTNCDCLRGSTKAPPDGTSKGGGVCVVTPHCDDNLPPESTDDPGSCFCPSQNDMGAAVQCLEPEQLCVGRGPYCPGANAVCIPAGQSCGEGTDDGGIPPQTVPVAGQDTFEPHCQFVDDVCCGGVVDAGVPVESD